VNPIFAIQEMKFYEVSDYMIWAGQQQFTTTVVTNADWYAADITDEQRQMIDETVAELADYIFEVQEDFNEKRLEMIKEAKPDMKMIELSPEERAVFEERASQVRDQYIEMVGEEGEEVLQALEQEIKDAEKNAM
jgi:TRAP-type C4-dicarboxylate transport system substrate-binding protein